MRTALLTAFFANFALFGASAILVGAAVPEIIREFSWSYLEIGVVLSAGSSGFFARPSSVAYSSDTEARKRPWSADWCCRVWVWL